MSLAEFQDILDSGRFRLRPGMMEGKWFADTEVGVRQHARSLYPNGDFQIVSAEVPEASFARLHRDDNLDHYGPATYLEGEDLLHIVPIVGAN